MDHPAKPEASAPVAAVPVASEVPSSKQLSGHLSALTDTGSPCPAMPSGGGIARLANPDKTGIAWQSRNGNLGSSSQDNAERDAGNDSARRLAASTSLPSLGHTVRLV